MSSETQAARPSGPPGGGPPGGGPPGGGPPGGGPPPVPPPTKKQLLIGFPCALIIPFLVILALKLTGAAAINFYIILFFIVCLIFKLLPNYVIGLGIAFIPVIVGVVPSSVTLSQLTDYTWWTLLFGFIVGAAFEKTGLSKRIGNALSVKFVKSWGSFLFTVFLFEFLLNILAPYGNTASIAIGITIFLPMAKNIGLKPRTRSFNGVALAIVTSNILTGRLTLTGLGTTPLAVGMFRPYHVFTYISWLKYITPVAFVSCVIAFIAIYLAFKPKEQINWNMLDDIREEHKNASKMNSGEIKSLICSLLVMLGFLTQSYTGINAGFLCVMLGVLLFIPGLGVLNTGDLMKMGWPFLLFMVGIFSIGGQMMYHDIHTALANATIPAALVGWSPIVIALYISVLLVLLHFVVGSMIPLLAAFVPAFAAFAVANGLNPMFMFGLVIIASSRWVFPFQEALVAMTGGLTRGELEDSATIKLGIILTIVFLVITVPLGTLYWQFIGAPPPPLP